MRAISKINKVQDSVFNMLPSVLSGGGGKDKYLYICNSRNTEGAMALTRDLSS